MDVVWLASYPRSGVTFLRHVLEQLYGLPTFSEYHEGVATINGLFDDKRHWPTQADGSLPVYFVKTHGTRMAGTRCPAIHLVRDGRDAAVSYAQFMHDFQGSSKNPHELLDDIIRGACQYGDWATHTLAWAGRPAARIRFNDLIANPLEVVRAAVESLHLGLKARDGATVKTFAELKGLHDSFFRKGEIGEWKMAVPLYIQAHFESHQGRALDWFAGLADAK